MADLPPFRVRTHEAVAEQATSTMADEADPPVAEPEAPIAEPEAPADPVETAAPAAAEAPADDARLASDNHPRLAEIRACIEDLIETADHSVLTVKGVRAHVLQKIDAEAGRDYDKSWLKAQVDEIMAAHRTSCAGGPSGEPEPATAPKQPVVPDSPGLGTVLWAKLPTYPFWPAMVVHPNKRQRAASGSGAGMVFVKFFGTHDFAFCETLLSWDSPEATALKSKLLAKKFQKDYALALAEVSQP